MSAYYIALARRLAGLKEYAWARATLEGIAETMERTDHCTLKQQEAIEHIMVGRLKHDVRTPESEPR
jgi:hypothetical protein